MGANITSDPTVLQSLSNIGYEVTWTGTSPVGTLQLQISNSFALNADGSVRTAGTWNPVPLAVGGSEVTSISITGNTGKGFIDVTINAGYASRLVYTRDSGTGTMTAIVTGKVT